MLLTKSMQFGYVFAFPGTHFTADVNGGAVQVVFEIKFENLAEFGMKQFYII